jgi:thiamine-phosphate pyrophosphorylase
LRNIYPIINIEPGSDLNEQLFRKCLAVSPKYIQLRMKGASEGMIARTAVEMIRIRDFEGSSSKIIVNDSLEAAVMSGADGVHFGQDDLSPLKARAMHPGLVIGWSTHTIEQVIKANAMDIDYIGFGPVFPTATKKMADAVVTELAERAAELSVHEIVFIGGINRNNIEFLPAGDKIFYALISGLDEMLSGGRK